jgi:hypothetical protein
MLAISRKIPCISIADCAGEDLFTRSPSHEGCSSVLAVHNSHTPRVLSPYGRTLQKCKCAAVGAIALLHDICFGPNGLVDPTMTDDWSS